MTLAPALAWEGRAARTEGYEFRLTDTEGTETGDVIHPQAAGMTVSVDGNSAVPRSLRGLVLVGSDADDLDPISDRVNLVAVIEDVDYPLGSFLFANVERTRGTGPTVLTATLVDQAVILGGETRHAVGFDQGTVATDAIAEVAALWPVTIEVVASTAQLPGPVAWPPGTSGARIIGDVCEAADYLPLYFDNAGIGQVRPTPSGTADHEYGPGSIVIAESVTDDEDLLEAFNTFVVTGGSGDNPIVGVYELPASAPQSVAERGFPVTYSRSNAAIASPAEARAIAEALADTVGIGYRTLSFVTTPNPTHDIFDTVDMEGTMYLETGWRLELSPNGDHSHDCVEMAEVEP